MSEQGDSKKGHGVAAVWVARNRFAVLDKNHVITIRDLQNKESRRIEHSLPVDDIFYVGVGLLFLRCADQLQLYDLQQKRVVAQIRTHKVKYVVWSKNMEYAALLSKSTLTLINKRLDVLCTVQESTSVKSGAWDDNGVFVYTTSNHIKYALTAGDHGIIRTLDLPVYIVALRGSKLYCLDRDASPIEIAIDQTEYKFKLALINRRYDEVLNMVRNANLVGQSIIAYLQKKGYPEVALHFVKDEKTRFGLALECGNLTVALEAAKVLDDKAVWEALGEGALLQGNHQIVETAYQRTKDFEKLSFLYLITGNLEKLKKMTAIARSRKDIQGNFQTALYLGDVEERIRCKFVRKFNISFLVLTEVGQHSLAYLTAATHGYEEEAVKLKAELEARDQPIPEVDPNAVILRTPAPIQQVEENWPLLSTSAGPFDAQILAAGARSTSKNQTVQAARAASQFAAVDDVEDEGEGDAWGVEGDLLLDDEGNPEIDEEELAAGEEEGGWDVDDDVELPPEVNNARENNEELVLTHGNPPPTNWINNTQRQLVDLVAAGAFNLVTNQLRHKGVIKIKPFRNIFLHIYAR